MVVYAVWDGVARVRFPAPRQIEIAIKFFWSLFLLFAGYQIAQVFYLVQVSQHALILTIVYLYAIV